jgi:hypothetical protein
LLQGRIDGILENGVAVRRERDRPAQFVHGNRFTELQVLHLQAPYVQYAR